MRNLKNLDLTKGSILKQFFLFAIPLFLGSLFQQLYSTTDLMFVGRIIGKEAAAAVGASGIIITCLIGLFSGISVGTGILVGNAYGAGKEKNLIQTIRTAIYGSVIGGLIVMLLGQMAARRALMMLGTPESILQDAVLYVRVYFFSMIPMILYNMCAAIFRARGDSNTPFYILAVGGILNVTMDALLVGVFRGGVAGAALATCISQSFTAGVSLFLLRNYLNGWELDKKILNKIVRIGFPIGIQSMIITLSNIFVQYVINGLGEDAIAAFAVYFKAENLVYLPIMAFGQAMVTFTSQNAGANAVGRIRRGVVQCNVVVSIIIFVIGFVGCKFAAAILGVFCKDTEVIEIGRQIIQVAFPWYFLYCILELTGGSIRGMGKTTQSMMVILGNMCVFRMALLAYVSSATYDVHQVAAVYPVTWFTTALSFVLYYICIITKERNTRVSGT